MNLHALFLVFALFAALVLSSCLSTMWPSFFGVNTHGTTSSNFNEGFIDYGSEIAMQSTKVIELYSKTIPLYKIYDSLYFDRNNGNIIEIVSTATSVADTPIDTSQQTANDKAISDKAISDKAISDKAISDKAISDKAISDKAISDKVISDKAISDKVISDKAIRDKAISDKVISDKAAISDKAISDKAISDKVISDKAISDNAISDKVAG